MGQEKYKPSARPLSFSGFIITKSALVFVFEDGSDKLQNSRLIYLTRRSGSKMSAQIHVVAILTPAPGKEARASSARFWHRHKSDAD